MERALIALTFIGFGIALLACGDGPTCTFMPRPPLGVTLNDARTGANVCSATVTARDGAYFEVLTLSPPADDAGLTTTCSYASHVVRPANYAIDIVARGYVPKTTTSIKVVTTCGDEQQPVTVAIDPI